MYTHCMSDSTRTSQCEAETWHHMSYKTYRQEDSVVVCCCLGDWQPQSTIIWGHCGLHSFAVYYRNICRDLVNIHACINLYTKHNTEVSNWHLLLERKGNGQINCRLKDGYIGIVYILYAYMYNYTVLELYS